MSVLEPSRLFDAEEMAATEAVQRWMDKTSATDPARDTRPMEIADFCNFTGNGPDELVKSCMLTTKDGLQKISIKGRRAMQESIEAFVAERGLSRHEAIVLGNRLRSFLIHNGVFIQGPASIR